jgi:hypothetical protein
MVQFFEIPELELASGCAARGATGFSDAANTVLELIFSKRGRRAIEPALGSSLAMLRSLEL